MYKDGVNVVSKRQLLLITIIFIYTTKQREGARFTHKYSKCALFAARATDGRRSITRTSFVNDIFSFYLFFFLIPSLRAVLHFIFPFFFFSSIFVITILFFFFFYLDLPTTCEDPTRRERVSRSDITNECRGTRVVVLIL